MIDPAIWRSPSVMPLIFTLRGLIALFWLSGTCDHRIILASAPVSANIILFCLLPFTPIGKIDGASSSFLFRAESVMSALLPFFSIASFSTLCLRSFTEELSFPVLDPVCFGSLMLLVPAAFVAVAPLLVIAFLVLCTLEHSVLVFHNCSIFW